MRIFLLITSILATVLMLIMFYHKGVDSGAVGGLVLFASSSVYFLFENRIDAWTERRQRKRIEDAYCKIENGYFYFPKGYYFKHGFLKDKKELPFGVIDEIRTNTHPISARVNGNEIVFLVGVERDAVVGLAEKGILLRNLQDNWALICEEFLDTELGPEFKEGIVNRLKDVGLNEPEVAVIRKKIRWRMLLLTYATWEWMYYGQYDVLKQFWPLTAKTYWWTMDIALRHAKHH